LKNQKFQKGKTCYSEEQVISMLEFLIDNIFVSFGGTLFQQVVGIPMGTNCAPLLTDLPEPVSLTFHSVLRKLYTEPFIGAFRNRPIRENNCLWRPCLLAYRDKMSNLYRRPSIDNSFQVTGNYYF
jgi:hypothetical protein